MHPLNFMLLSTPLLTLFVVGFIHIGECVLGIWRPTQVPPKDNLKDEVPFVASYPTITPLPVPASVPIPIAMERAPQPPLAQEPEMCVFKRT